MSRETNNLHHLIARVPKGGVTIRHIRRQLCTGYNGVQTAWKKRDNTYLRIVWPSLISGFATIFNYTKVLTMASKGDVGNLAARPDATLPAIAVISSSFLSGAMMSLSAFVIPVLLDTNASPGHIVRQWVRLYHYGHIYLPALCIATCGFYGISAFQRAGNGRKWRAYGHAALSTISMVPFTWAIMAPTNNALFELDNSISATELTYVKALVVRWAWMHVTRSLSPLLGAYLGFAYLIEEQRL